MPYTLRAAAVAAAAAPPARVGAAAALVAVLAGGAGLPACAQVRLQYFTQFSSASDFVSADTATFEEIPVVPNTQAPGSLVLGSDGQPTTVFTHTGTRYGFTATTPTYFDPASNAANALYAIDYASTKKAPTAPTDAPDDIVLSTYVFNQPLVFTFENSPAPVFAFGGTLFVTNYEGFLLGNQRDEYLTITAEDTSGRKNTWKLGYDTRPTTFSDGPFFGVRTGGTGASDPPTRTPLRSVTVSVGPDAYDGQFVTVNNIFVGSVTVDTPEPGALPLAAVGLTMAAVHRPKTRRTIKQVPTPA